MVQFLCSNCGNVIQANDRFCRKCGAPTGQESNSQPNSPLQPEQRPDQNRSKPHKITIFFSFLFLICLLYGLAGSLLDSVLDIDLPFRTEILTFAIVLFCGFFVLRLLIKLFRRFLLVDNSKTRVDGNRQWYKRPTWWLLILSALLILITFPLWNPQKLYVNSLIRDLGNQQTAGHAIQVLSQEVGAPAIKPLIKALGSTDTLTREGAIEGLVRIGPPAIQPLIDELLENNSGAQEVLIRMGEPAVVPLLEALSTPGSHSSNSIILVVTLQRMGLSALDPLMAAASEGTSSSRYWAAYILLQGNCYENEGPILICAAPGGANLEQATGLLTELLSDSEPMLRALAVEALTNASWMEDQKIPGLLAALEDESSEVRKKAVQQFQSIKEDRAIDPLARLLDDESQTLRIETALALAYQGPSGVAALTSELGGQSIQDAAQNCVEIIQKGDEESLEILIAALFGVNDTGMATIYLNSGSPWLESAARLWADQNGYYIEYYTAGQGSAITWGSNK